MKAIFSGVLLMMLCLIAEGSDAFAEANDHFEKGRYEEAAKAYEAILEEGPRVSVLNNLGSAYFRRGDKGRAILAFERALLLSPGDPDLRANLKLAQDEAAVFPLEKAKRWRGFLGGIPRNTLAMIALVAAVVLPLAALAMMKFGRNRKLALVVVLFALMVLRITLSPMEDQLDQESRGIVLAKPATVRLSPFEKAEPRGTLTSGREVVLGRLENGYFWISASEGATEGWVRESEVARIIPGQSPG